MLLLSGYVAGWVRGFPRWWWSFPLILIIFSILVQNSVTDETWFFGMQSSTRLWGWMARIPLAAATLLALLISFFTRPYSSLLQGIWQDPTRLAFGLYSILPYFTIMYFDETRGYFSTPFLIVSFIVFLASAWFYLRSANPTSRLLILLGSAIGMITINLTAITIYWNGRMEAWMTTPARWQDSVYAGMMIILLMAILLVLPVIVVELARRVRSLQSPMRNSSA